MRDQYRPSTSDQARSELSGEFSSLTKIIVLALGVVFFIWAASHFFSVVKEGMRLFEFGDETEKFVAAQMIDHGLRLYRDIFAHHGPLLYMLAHLYSQLVSQSDFSSIRLIVVIFASVSCISLAYSPIINTVTARFWSVAIYLILLSFVWLLQGMQMLLYPTIGGFLFVVPLTQIALPAFLDKSFSRIGVFASAFCFVMACFAAYAFGPAAVFFVVSVCLALLAARKKLAPYGKPFLIGIIAALSIVVLWQIFYGDFVGYFVYHFYFNQEIYSSFISFSLTDIWKNFNISWVPQERIRSLTTVLMGIWLSGLLVIIIRKAKAVRDLLLLCGSLLFLLAAVLFINPFGGDGFHGAGYVVVNFAAISLLLGWMLESQIRYFCWSNIFLCIVSIAAVIFFSYRSADKSISSPYGVAKKDYSAFLVAQKPVADGMYAFIRSVTSPKDKILSLIFNPSIYIRAGRLPASGDYYYLPWQAKYKRDSIDGYSIDICSDIETKRPPIIWFDDWKVWNKYRIEQYEPCVPKLIESNYVRYLEYDDLYVRKDIAEKDPRIFVVSGSPYAVKLPLLEKRNLDLINSSVNVTTNCEYSFVDKVFVAGDGKAAPLTFDKDGQWNEAIYKFGNNAFRGNELLNKVISLKSNNGFGGFFRDKSSHLRMLVKDDRGKMAWEWFGADDVDGKSVVVIPRQFNFGSKISDLGVIREIQVGGWGKKGIAIELDSLSIATRTLEKKCGGISGHHKNDKDIDNTIKSNARKMQ